MWRFGNNFLGTWILLVFPCLWSVLLESCQISPCILCVLCCLLSSVIPAVPSSLSAMQAYPLHLAAYISFPVSPNPKWLWNHRASEPCSWGSTSPRAWTERRALLNLGWNNPPYYSPVLPSPYLFPRISNWAGHQLSVFPKSHFVEEMCDVFPIQFDLNCRVSAEKTTICWVLVKFMQSILTICIILVNSKAANSWHT